MREAPIKERVREPRALRDFGVRTVTAIILGVVLILADISGSLLLWAAVISVVAVFCVIEFYAMMRTERRKPNEVFGVVAVAAMPLAAALYALHWDATAIGPADSAAGAMGLTAVSGGLIVAALIWHILFKQVTESDTATTVFGALYTGFMLSHLVLMRALDSGAELVIITLASVWCMDVFAYLVGSAIGRNPMAPQISPKKSWEGFVAGAIATTAAWGVGWWVVRSPLPLWTFLAIGVIAAIAAVLGDLAESRLKREVGVKDSGKWLPGHGGFLDRFDSMIMVSIVVYYLLIWAGAR
ncbi:MAG: phosphatidate cytidylyltransferase [Coriobacteriia bacterium]|nr:phosphatidate cytidylyltransferase [Coriobacteriia bacterium]